MKYVTGLLLSLASLFLLFSSCEDYIETGIEGQWQMTKVLKADGSEQPVDSIYYLFKKGVFKYLRMETDLEPYRAFGQYREYDGKLGLNLTDFWSEPHQAGVHWGTNAEGGYIAERTYNVTRHTSSALELEFDGDIYIFRKY